MGLLDKLGSLMPKYDPTKAWQQKEAAKTLEKKAIQQSVEKTRDASYERALERAMMNPGKIVYSGKPDFNDWATEQSMMEKMEKRIEMDRQYRLAEHHRMNREMMEEHQRRKYLDELERIEQQVRQMEQDDENFRRVERYTDAEGRTFLKPVENKIKPVVHKSGHFPIEWMVEARRRADESDFLIRIEAEERCVAIIGEVGEDYADHLVVWEMMEKAEVNPLIPAIENVERQLRVVSSLQQQDKRKHG